MTDKLIGKLVYGGYRKMQSSDERPGYCIYYDLIRNLVNAVVLVEADKYNQAFVEDFKRVFSASMERQGLNAHIFTVLVTDSSKDNITEQMSIAKQVCDFEKAAWIYDENEDSLMVSENQLEEFYGLRGLLEKTDIPEDFFAKEQEERTEAPSGKTSFKQFWKDLPKVTFGLVLINILVFIVCTFTGPLLYNKGGVGISLMRTPGEWYRIFSSMFLHLNATHILNNMLLLYCLGELVEKEVGPIVFFVIYFLTGVSGTLLTFVSELLSQEYVVVFGASGAVFGILGVMFSLVFFKRINKRTMTVGRILLVVTLTLLDGFNPETNIANWSHIGGLISGVLFGCIICLCTKKGSKA